MPVKPKTFGKKKATPKTGGSANLRDTSAAYQRLRQSIFDEEALCRYDFNRGHIVAAEVIDHIVALALGGTNDRDNLAPACRACNDAKSRDEVRYLKRGYDLASVRFDPAMAEWFRLAAKPPKDDR